MKNNISVIEEVIEFIEAHLTEDLDLNRISQAIGYSKYHLSRMFESITGFTIHGYIRRRRLTCAAQMLVFTDRPIMEIALISGYSTQQSFNDGFRALFHTSPRAYRKRGNYCPYQLKFTVEDVIKDGIKRFADIRMEERQRILLTGFRANTRRGFFVIGKCWRQLHSKKHLIQNRKDTGYLIGVNDYSKWLPEHGRQPAFDYLAAAEVTSFGNVGKGMEAMELPSGKYVVFSFRMKAQDSIEPVSEYVYREWFPQSTCRLNENARYDFVRYKEETDSEGKSLIEYCVPVM